MITMSNNTDTDRITILEEHTLLLTARVAELETLFGASADKLTAIIGGVQELKKINRELARLNDIELAVLEGRLLQ
jgi:hypothetical protein